MNTMELVMKRLGLVPPPPPTPPPAFLAERTPAEIGRPMQQIYHPPRYRADGIKTHEGYYETVPVRGDVVYGETYYNVHLGLDPVALQKSYERLQANLKRMRRDALNAVGATRNTPEAPLFRLRP